jgi:HD-GYP domain-containing protein (c-di-GMP phosphodiesterase class II)
MIQLLEEKETLGRELLRCHEQLNLVFEITGHIAKLHDPDAIQGVLLRRYGAMLKAGALFLDRAGCCVRLDLAGTGGKRLEVSPEHVRAALAPYVEAVRRSRRALVAPLTQDEAAPLGGARALLATLPRADTEMGVVVALRDSGEPPFDAGDVLASESVLAYGAQVLGNVLTVRHLQRTALETVCTLVNAIDAKDNYTSAHSERVGGFARLTGQALGLPRVRLQTLEWAGLLHDVGKIGIPETILNKAGPLTPEEFEHMKRHARVGHEVLKPVAQFEPVLEAVLYHHENFDGSGYPEGLQGQQIPLDARIIHVVDIFDALTTTRPYRDSYDFEQAARVLEAGAGGATDPEITRLFIETLRRYRAEEPAGFRARFGHLTEPHDGPTANPVAP